MQNYGCTNLLGLVLIPACRALACLAVFAVAATSCAQGLPASTQPSVNDAKEIDKEPLVKWERAVTLAELPELVKTQTGQELLLDPATFPPQGLGGKVTLGPNPGGKTLSQIINDIALFGAGSDGPDAIVGLQVTKNALAISTRAKLSKYQAARARLVDRSARAKVIAQRLDLAVSASRDGDLQLLESVVSNIKDLDPDHPALAEIVNMIAERKSLYDALKATKQ